MSSPRVLAALSSSLLEILFWLSVFQQQRMLMHCQSDCISDWTTSRKASRAGSASDQIGTDCQERGRRLGQAGSASGKAACHIAMTAEAQPKETTSTHIYY